MTHVTPGMWSHLGQTATVWPGRNYPLGASWSEESTNFAVYAPAGTQAWVCLFDDEDVETRYALTERSLGIWHGALPGIAPGTRYGYRVDGPWLPKEGLRFNPHKLLLDPYGQAVSGGFTPHPAAFGYDQARPRRAEPRGLRAVRPPQRGGQRRLRLGRRHPDASPLARHRHLRDARQGHDRAPRPGARGAARHVRRAGDAGGHRLPARPGRDRGRAAARAPVRLRAGAGRPGHVELLGLQLDRVLRPAPRLLLLRRPRRPGVGVQADGQGVPRRRARGPAGRGLQPHRRGRGRGTDAVLPGPRRPGLLPPGPARRATSRPRRPPSTTPTGTSPAAATPSTPRTRWPCG